MFTEGTDAEAGMELQNFVYLIQSESESEVTQSCPTLYNPMDCSLPASSFHGIFQARIVKWVAISFSRGLMQRAY